MPSRASSLWALLLVLPVVAAVPSVGRADATSGVGATLTRLSAELERAAPDDAARRLAGHTLTDARRVLSEAQELVRLGRIDDARSKVRLVELRVRLVSLAVDAARLEAMARERERAAVRIREEARVARAAFEQAYERRVELERAPTEAGAGEPAAAGDAASSNGDK